MSRKKALIPKESSEWDRLQQERKYYQQKLSSSISYLTLEQHQDMVRQLREVKSRLNKLAAEGHGQ